MRISPGTSVVAVVVALAVVTLTSDLQAQAQDPVIGKWKLNLGKSTHDPGPPPKSVMRTFEDRGGDVIVATVEGVGATGDPAFSQYVIRHDGKFYPYLTRGTQTARAIAYTRKLKARSWEWVIHQDGKPAVAGTTTVSEDGKTLTIVTKGTNSRGQVVNNSQVFERQ